MRNGAVAVVVILLVIVSAVAGYTLSVVNQHTSTMTTTTFTTNQHTSTITTTISTTNQNSCTPVSSLPDMFVPVGFLVTVSYDGNWSLSIASFASKVVNANAFSGACYYEGSGTMTFYVGLADYLGGWSTVVVLAHKFGSNGTLTASASIGDEANSNSTTQSYGSVIATISFNLIDQ
jgi:hypothetical protein